MLLRRRLPGLLQQVLQSGLLLLLGRLLQQRLWLLPRLLQQVLQGGLLLLLLSRLWLLLWLLQWLLARLLPWMLQAGLLLLLLGRLPRLLRLLRWKLLLWRSSSWGPSCCCSSRCSAWDGCPLARG